MGPGHFPLPSQRKSPHIFPGLAAGPRRNCNSKGRSTEQGTKTHTAAGPNDRDRHKSKAAKIGSQHYWKENSHRYTGSLPQPTAPHSSRQIPEDAAQDCVWVLGQYQEFRGSSEAQISIDQHILTWGCCPETKVTLSQRRYTPP